MIKRGIGGVAAGLVTVLIMLPVLPAVADEVPRLAKEQARGMLGNPDVVVIDVRAHSVQPGDLKIVGAVVEDPKKVEDWAKAYPKSKMLILYCA